jgi:hypothetical protein
MTGSNGRARANFNARRGYACRRASNPPGGADKVRDEYRALPYDSDTTACGKGDFVLEAGRA